MFLFNFLACSACLFVIVVGRYFLFAGVAYWWCYGKKREAWSNRKIDPAPPPADMVRREIIYSILSSVLFAVAGAGIYFAWEAGVSRIYLRPDELGWWYLPASFCLLMLLHETYFYWTHRLMHLPVFFQRVHLVHHESRNPSPFAAFSFHPLEAVIEAAIFPLLVFLVPVHVLVLLTFLMVMTVLSVFNHLGYELYPRGLASDRIGKYLITATHHFQHHRRVGGNYGLYFTFWDRWMRTEHADYPELYARVTCRRSPEGREGNPRPATESERAVETAPDRSYLPGST